MFCSQVAPIGGFEASGKKGIWSREQAQVKIHKKNHQSYREITTSL
jgi:hypothetical protein